jgi:hypothetical protein
MQAAYGDSDIVEEMFDSTETDIKAIGEALKAVAGQWANMRDSARLGAINPQADITENLLQAIGMIRKARRERQSLNDLVNQPDLMSGETPDPMTVGVLRIFYDGTYFTRAVGRDKLVNGLTDYVRGAMSTSADAGLFGGEPVSASDILATITDPEGVTNAQTQPQESSREPAGSGVAGRGAGEGRGAQSQQRPETGGTGSDQDRRGQPGQDAQAQGQQQDGPRDQATDQGDEAAVLTEEQERLDRLAQVGVTPLGPEPTEAEYEAAAYLVKVGTVLRNQRLSPEITSKVPIMATGICQLMMRCCSR